MKPWEIIDHEPVPNDDGTIYLMCRGTEFSILVNGRELMTNRMHGSEDALSDFACERLERLDNARILVGGLGMGFTLAAALRQVGEAGEVVVAELMPAVVRWNHQYVGRAARHPLKDPRSKVFQGDVADLIDGVSEDWSAILLDIDNGPDALTRPTNGWLYSYDGLRRTYEALIPGGVLGVWSAYSDDKFTGRLKSIGYEVEVIQFTEDGRPTPDDSGTHVLWMARRPALLN